MQVDDFIDDCLKRLPVWEPSPQFAERVAALGARVARSEPPPRAWSWPAVVDGITAAVLVTTVGWLGGDAVSGFGGSWSALAAPTPQAVWAWVVGTYAALWLMLRTEGVSG